jgi:hypothetical protein
MASSLHGPNADTSKPERAIFLNRALEEQRLEVPDAVQLNVTTFNAVIDNPE